MTFKEKLAKIKKLGYEISETETFLVDTFIDLDSIENEDAFTYRSFEKDKKEPKMLPTFERFGFTLYKNGEIVDFELTKDDLVEMIDEILKDTH